MGEGVVDVRVDVRVETTFDGDSAEILYYYNTNKMENPWRTPLSQFLVSRSAKNPKAEWWRRREAEGDWCRMDLYPYWGGQVKLGPRGPLGLEKKKLTTVVAVVQYRQYRESVHCLY